MGYKELSRKELGDYGEQLAVEHLRRAGLNILAQNYRCPKGEIDIVARDEKWLVIVEVRTRSTKRAGSAEESIDCRKLQRLQSLASYYLMVNHYREWPALRFDVVAINFTGDTPQINWIKGV